MGVNLIKLFSSPASGASPLRVVPCWSNTRKGTFEWSTFQMPPLSLNIGLGWKGFVETVAVGDDEKKFYKICSTSVLDAGSLKMVSHRGPRVQKLFGASSTVPRIS